MANIDKVKTIIKNEVSTKYNTLINMATSYAKAELHKANDVISGQVASKINNAIPYKCNEVNVKDLYDIIDNIALTRDEYAAMKTYVDQIAKDIRNKINKDYSAAMNMVALEFKKYLYKNASVAHLNVRNADKIMDKIYEKAYNDGHSDGYTNVEYNFDELDSIVTDSIKLANG